MRPCEDKGPAKAEMVSETPKGKSQPANRSKAKKEGESPKSGSKKSPLKLAADAARRMMEKKKGDGIKKNLAADFEKMAEKREEKKAKRVKKPLDTTDLATYQSHSCNFCKLELICSL